VMMGNRLAELVVTRCHDAMDKLFEEMVTLGELEIVHRSAVYVNRRIELWQL